MPKARYPGAVWRPIARNFTNATRTRTRAVILHTTASAGSTSMHGWFSNPSARASSHFHVDNAGRVEQYVDARKIAWTSGAGNATTIGIETQGDGSGPWTDAQMAALADLVRWCARTFDFPLRKMGSSRPNARGVGTHRLGVDGNFPTKGVQRGRQQRAKKGLGESWSSARGKICPGYDRQAQWPLVVRMAQTHTVTRRTAGRKGAACYSERRVGKKRITRVLPLGKTVRIVRFRGKWGRTLKGDWIKLSKITG